MKKYLLPLLFLVAMIAAQATSYAQLPSWLTQTKTFSRFWGDGSSTFNGPTSGNTVTLYDSLADSMADQPYTIFAVHVDADDLNLIRHCILEFYVDGESVPGVSFDIGTMMGFQEDARYTPKLSTLHFMRQSYPTGGTSNWGGTAGNYFDFSIQLPWFCAHSFVIKCRNPGVSVTGHMFGHVDFWPSVSSQNSNLRLRSANLPYRIADTVAYNADYTYCDFSCAGSLAAFALAMKGSIDETYIDRDLFFYVDGESTASYQNNGTEDFFDAGWYDNGLNFSSTPRAMTYAANFSSKVFMANRDLISSLGGLKFASGLKIKHLSDAVTTTNNDHTVGWAALYYCDTSVSAVPSAPRGLAGTHGSAQVTLTWRDPDSLGSAAITNQVVTYSPSGGTPSTPVSVSPGTRTLTVTGLTNGTPYTFNIKDVSSAGTGTASSNVVVTPSSTDTLSNLQAYWNLDEAGTGNALDSSGGSLALTAGNAPGAANSDGRHFVRSSSQYFSHASTAALQFGPQSWTVAAVVNPDSLPTSFSNAAIFGKRDSTSGNAELIVGLDEATSEYVVAVYTATDSQHLLQSTAGATSPGASSFVCARYNSGSGLLSITVNGHEDHVTQSSLQAAGSAEFDIGRINLSGFFFYWDGRIKNAGVWHRYLSDADVADLYNSGAGRTYSGLHN